MEYKVRKESQTLMEKTFNRFERRGRVSKDDIEKMLKLMNPDLEINRFDLNNMIDIQAKGHGMIDMEGFNHIAVHFLLKQAKHDHDQFIHKHEVRLRDFEDED